LSQIRRLSIDIDIVCGIPPRELDTILLAISNKPPFTGYQEEHRENQGLPNRRHFSFAYRKIEGGHPSPSILLDVVEDKESYPSIVTKPIATAFIEVDKETIVRVPTLDGLLADKLTAFAPYTIGVSFTNKHGVDQFMRVAKHLFDIGELFNHVTSFAQVITAYRASFEKENGYHGSAYQFEQALEDTFNISYHYCGIRLKKFPQHPDAIKLDNGRKALANHLVGGKYNSEMFIKIAAAKAVFLSQAILKNQTGLSLEQIRYSLDKIEEIRTAEIAGAYAALNRLKVVNPEAFYYWWQMSRM
jgi:hypothetical protein